jgi:hypothetical protein
VRYPEALADVTCPREARRQKIDGYGIRATFEFQLLFGDS